MTDIVFLNYSFIFDPSQMFSHLSEFESELGKFFAERGIEANKINSDQGKVLYLKRIDPLIIGQTTPAKVEPQKSTKQMIAQLSQSKWQDGKYRKENPTIRVNNNGTTGVNS